MRFSRHNNQGGHTIRQVSIQISIGELVDRATIMFIKLNKIASEEKLAHVRKSYAQLEEPLNLVGITVNSDAFRRLLEINTDLWEIEDALRCKERQQAFDDEFIRLARKVYLLNDRRSAIKREISRRYGCDLIEEKQYG